MNAAEARRQVLLNKTVLKDVTPSTMSTAGERRDNKNNRTTRMLLAVVILFLVTELPQGIINLLNGLLQNFVEEVFDYQ